MRYHNFATRVFFGLRFWLLYLILALFFVNRIASHAPLNAAQSHPVAIVSAASYEATAIAPGAIAAAFGVQLATRTETAMTVPLPTNLAGTTMRLRDSAGSERLAPLFFVSSGQINFLIPAEAATGTATINVVSGDGTQSQGTFDIKPVSPSIFTANANGRGVPAAVALRVKANNEQVYEPVSELDASAGRMRPRPLDLGPASETVFLLLFYTGTLRAADPNNDGNRNESVRLLLGGVEITPAYAGPQGDLIGLDQMNLALPRSLIGSGRISLSIVAGDFTSNAVEIEIASPTGAAPPTVSGFNAATVLAGQTLEIQGNGFAGNATDNLVRIGGVEATVSAANATRLGVVVPFGVETGLVTVRTPQGEGSSNAALPVRTSISGVVENTDRVPLKDVSVKLRQSASTVNTNTNGAFVLPDPPTNSPFSVIEVDGSKLPVTPPFGKLSLLTAALANRDNQLARPLTLQQINGTAAQVGGSGLQADDKLTLSLPTYAAATEPAQTPTQIQNGNVMLGFSAGTQFLFPNGGKSGVLTLTQVQSSRTPITLPKGVFSSIIVQITPFGTRFSPGGNLTFPNSDGLPAGATVKLYRLDQTPDSPTLGSFIVGGTATVSADGQTIFAPNGSVPEATYYLVALERATTTVIGRVLDSNRAPARQAVVDLRGQHSLADGSGAFVIRDVVVQGSSDQLVVEASYVRPNGRVERAQSSPRAAVSGGITNVGDIVLQAPTSNQPPYLLVSSMFTVRAGFPETFDVLADDPDDVAAPVTVRLTGPGFATIARDSLFGNLYTLRLAPTLNDLGNHTLMLTATDGRDGTTTRNVTVMVNNLNRPPAVAGLLVETDEDRSVTIPLIAEDPDNDPLTYIIVTPPQRGTLSGTGSSRTYTPAANFNGSDRFTFKVNDGRADSLTEANDITVKPVNDAPLLTVPGAQSVQPGQAVSFTVSATDPDAGQTLTYAASNLPSGATFNAATRQFSWTPTSAQTGTFTVMFTATDNGTPPLSDSKTVAITVVAPATGTVTGVVRNAQTGQVLPGATIAIANSALTTTSNSAGAYTLANVPPGARTLTAAATGFAATQFAINVVAEQTLTQNISLSPTLATGQLRITLNWTKDAAGVPEDLDAHLYGPRGNNQCFHVYWEEPGSLTAAPFAALEVDNIELPGSPPTETIRIAQQTAGTYRFFIHDFEGELADGLSRSRATVQVFGSNGLLRTYVVPSGAGEFWDVFELNGQTGALTDINRLTATPPPLACGNVACTYSVAPTSQSFTATGGTGSASVTTQANCTWTATSNAGFITITSGASGTGNGTVNYSVAANTTTAQRTGTLTIAGQTFTVTQAAATTGLTVRDRRLTVGPIPDACSPPAAKTAYLTTDERIYQWTLVSGARIGDLVRWEFVQPNGSVAFTGNYTVAFNDNLCFWAAMNIAGAAAASLPGNWQVRLFYNNALLFTDSFTISTGSGVCTPPPAGMVGWWPGDGNANDIRGANPGTLQNGATFTTGQVGQAFSFDGTDDYVSTNLDAQPSVMPSTTWDAWVFPTRVNQTGFRQGIMSIDTGGFARSVLIETGTANFGIFTGLGVWQPTTVTLNQWQHIAVVYTPTGIRFYKNGVEFVSSGGPNTTATTGRFQIGRFPGFPQYFQGRIDEVEVFNRALTQAEIQAIYNAGSAGKCKTASATNAEIATPATSTPVRPWVKMKRAKN